MQKVHLFPDEDIPRNEHGKIILEPGEQWIERATGLSCVIKRVYKRFGRTRVKFMLESRPSKRERDWDECSEAWFRNNFIIACEYEAFHSRIVEKWEDLPEEMHVFRSGITVQPLINR